MAWFSVVITNYQTTIWSKISISSYSIAIIVTTATAAISTTFCFGQRCQYHLFHQGRLVLSAGICLFTKDEFKCPVQPVLNLSVVGSTYIGELIKTIIVVVIIDRHRFLQLSLQFNIKFVFEILKMNLFFGYQTRKFCVKVLKFLVFAYD